MCKMLKTSAYPTLEVVSGRRLALAVQDNHELGRLYVPYFAGIRDLRVRMLRTYAL